MLGVSGKILLLIFPLLFGGRVSAQNEPASSIGMDFILGIPLTPTGQTPRYELTIGTPSNLANYTIESRAGEIAAGSVTSSSPAAVIVNNTFQVASSGIDERMKGIRVRATGQNPVYVLVTIKYNFFGSFGFLLGYGSYLVHPNVELQNGGDYVYYAMSTDYAGSSASVTDRRSNILLVGNQDITSVSITPTQTVSLPQNAQSDSPLVQVAAGATHNVTLNSLQTLGFSSLLDLTGTKIVSDKPLTVITGHQCAQVPSTAGFCEPIYIHIPPTFNWGQLFLLAPLGGRTANQYYKLVTSENSTTITHRCGMGVGETQLSPTAGSGRFLFFPSNSYCYLTASNPIFVVQMAPGGNEDNIGDPGLAIVAPTSGHVKTTTFINLLADFQTSFITVTLKTEHFNASWIQLDGSPLGCTWNNIYNIINDDIIGHGCTFSVAAGTHVVSHSEENGVLSVIAYGWNTEPNLGYAYLTNINLEPREQTTNVTIDSSEVIFDEFLPFYNLSGIPGLQELPRAQDSNSPPIFVPGGLIYGAEEVTQIFVNENGAFSFNTPWMFSHPNRYPTTYLPTRQGHVLSPFWSDVDIRSAGTVRYVPIVRGSSTLGDRIMDEASTYINDRFIGDNETLYQPTWMLVAQWDGVHPHPHGSDDHEGIDEEYLNRTNTFQGVIITDTVRSFYVFNFTCGEIQWSGQGSETAIVGYNSNGDYFNNHPANGFPDIGRIISCTRYIIPNRRRMKRETLIIQRNDTTSGTSGECPTDQATQFAKRQCRNIAMFDNSTFTDVDDLRSTNGNRWNATLPKCPPTGLKLDLSPEFEPFPLQGGDCHRSKNRFIPSGAEGYVFVSICCYDMRINSRPLIRTGLDAGRLTNINRNFDIEFKVHCCNTSLCNKYTDRRPIIEVQRENEEAGSCGGWGDPHYTSFDKRRYTFSASGEYTLFGVTTPRGSEVFHIQGRLGPRGWPATTTVALAFGVPGEYGYQFVHNDQAVLLQTIPTLQQVNNVNNSRVQITLNGDSLTANIAVVNIRITATWLRRHMRFHIFVPRFLCEVSFGHLGNCDGNPDNDVSGPNDHRINITQTLFTYGNDRRRKKRETDERPLNYTYEENNILKKRQIDGPDFVCTSFDNCGDHNFVGVTLEDLTFTEEQRAMCNNDETCLFDLVVTGDEGFANTTLEASEESTRVQDIISNVPPNIAGDDIFRVNVREENVYTFTVNDTNDFNVTIEGGAPEGGVLSNDGDGMYTFTWTPPATPANGLSFIAMDNPGAATLHSPVVQVCACFNGGQCTEQGVPMTDTLIQILTCLCTEAYAGDTCSEDKNGCAEIECFQGVECFDVPAPGVGAVCGPCEPGFTGDGLKCTDLDECAQNNSLCNQICMNTFGSYECSCEPGYTLINAVCVDIDECSGVNDCQQGCTNTPGSFSCTCGSAFTLDVDGKTCNPRTVCGANSCSHICAVIGGQDECFCPIGFELATGSTTTCQDIDECERFSPCNQICTNTDGSFECSCNAGFQLQNAMQTCEDIDECRMAALAGLVICLQANTQCVNTNGSFECVCVGGYELVDAECERVVNEVIEPPRIVVPMLGQENAITFVVETYQLNELTTERLQEFRIATAMAITTYCARNECVLITSDGPQSSLNVTVRPQHIAIPRSNITNGTDGGPVLTFYAQLNSETVVSSNILMMAVKEAEDIYRDAGFLPDVNECATDNGGCNQTCTNTDGSFECSCGTGYTLGADNLDCDDVDECQTNNGGCNQTCNNTVGSFSCSCGIGYILAANNLDCEDMDECQTNNGGCNQICTNTVGSFECSCGTGYTLAADNLNCDDMNECQNSNGGCNQTCTNTLGSFECSCGTGYILSTNNFDCNDIDECQTNNGGCNQTCTNTIGSFECSCGTGYTLAPDDLDCDDVDECQTNNGGCNQTCNNTAGSFECSCGSGFILAANNLDCKDVNECQTSNGGCNQTCTNIDGLFECSCGAGYTLAANDLDCDDVDECNTNNGGCNQTCNNTYGSFKCSCIKGYQLAADNLSCNDLSNAPNLRTIVAVILSVVLFLAVVVVLIFLIPYFYHKRHTDFNPQKDRISLEEL